MKRLTAPWTTALATAALLALPAAGSAQTPQTAPEPQPERSTTLSTPANQNEAPAEHLRQAKEALAKIDASTVPARAKSQMAALRRHISALERSAAANDTASAAGSAPRSTNATPKARGTAAWANDVAAIDRIITELAGGGAASSTGTGDPGTAGTSGTEPRTTTKSKSSAAVTLDESARTQLMEVRTHITAFAAAMSGTSSSSSSPSSAAGASQTPSASGTSGTTSSAAGQTGSPATAPTESTPETQTEPATTGTTGQTGQTGSSTTSPTSPTGQTAPGEAGSTAAAQSKVDAEAAKQHLTAARDVLTQLTQLPAAAQLQGDARTQVSQLIQNFNELITTQADWRSTYAKLEANLSALIGPAPQQTSAEATATTPPAATPETAPETTPANPPATQPANPPAGTQTGTPGAVGTSGTSSGAASLDAAIRQKLVEFRTHLQAFHTAAGGGESK